MSALKVVNPKIKRHKDFGETAYKLAKEYENEEIIYGEACGELLHSQGFYEGAISKERAEFLLHCVERFLKLMDNILNSKEKG